MLLQKTAKGYGYKLSGLLITLILMVSVLFLPHEVLARELSIEEAIELGLKNSDGMEESRRSLEQLERRLEEIKAQQDWQIDLGAGYSETFFGKDEELGYGLSSRDGNGLSLQISANRSYSSGLRLSPEISIQENEGDTDTDFSIGLALPLYPALPDNLLRSYYTTEKNLLNARDRLLQQESSTIISWLEKYLALLRFEEKIMVYREGLNRAEENLKEVEERMAIGDAGEYQLITARMSLQNARYSLLQAEKQLEDARYSFALELGISPEEEITIRDENNFIRELRERSAEIAAGFQAMSKEGLMEKIEDKNNELKANLIGREVLEQEFSWLEKENDPALNLSGSYNSNSEDLRLGLNLSYQLYDGGQHRLSLEAKEEEIADNISSYDDLYKGLQQQLKQHLDNLKLSQFALDKEGLNLEKSLYELDIANQQFEIGLIDYSEYQDAWTSTEETEIKIGELEDDLLLGRLKFICFVDRDIFDEIMGRN